MIEVLSLLTLPKTSNAFTAIRSNAIDPPDNGLASPRRKAARLDTDSDAASASRSTRNATADGPFKIRIIGDERECLHTFCILRILNHTRQQPRNPEIQTRLLQTFEGA